ncbi:fumarylacetoacetate hydrolase [Naematelia encephala]|uniref:Fumarylacetoacetate hydrolase n=1 Tax=Naematelia encephala TaxID=71784 RepID=A0A1Y2ARX0_9TREE|nr:fumarylacetoacetate hydrolase [Naematelia encephala]
MTIPPTATWKRLIRFIDADGVERLGEPCHPEQDVGLAMRNGEVIEAFVVDSTTPWDQAAVTTGQKVHVTSLLSPITGQQAGTIRCTGLSYTDHAAEMGLALPDVPSVFLKPGQAVNNPNSTVVVPKTCQREEMDWEVELAIVIGKECKDVSESEAMDYVLGYTIANDLTARKHQASSSQWCYAKGFDGFCPLGPVLVSTRSLPDPHIVKLTTDVNGKRKQTGSASLMIFPLKHVISYLSQGSTLSPGTVIITGTPPGIGSGMRPPQWLKDGDEVHCWISDGMGTLVNKIVYA